MFNLWFVRTFGAIALAALSLVGVVNSDEFGGAVNGIQSAVSSALGWLDTTVKSVIAFESFESEAYLDPVGVPTIGYGTTVIDGQPVRLGMTVTEEEARGLLMQDVERFDGAIAQHVTVPLNDNQRAALNSWAYNVGEDAVAGSTLVRRLNQGDYGGAAAELERWNKATDRRTGQVRELPGLTTRRSVEQELFLTPVGDELPRLGY